MRQRNQSTTRKWKKENLNWISTVAGAGAVTRSMGTTRRPKHKVDALARDEEEELRYLWRWRFNIGSDYFLMKVRDDLFRSLTHHDFDELVRLLSEGVIWRQGFSHGNKNEEQIQALKWIKTTQRQKWFYLYLSYTTSISFINPRNCKFWRNRIWTVIRTFVFSRNWLWYWSFVRKGCLFPFKALKWNCLTH